MFLNSGGAENVGYNIPTWTKLTFTIQIPIFLLDNYSAMYFTIYVSQMAKLFIESWQKLNKHFSQKHARRAS